MNSDGSPSAASQKIVMAGATGLIGTELSDLAAARGYEVVQLVRKLSSHPTHRQVLWEGKGGGAWTQEFEGARAVINLSGRSVACKWTDENRQQILDSRVETTTAFAKAIAGCKVPPEVWINASAVGYYGDRGEEQLDEGSKPGEGFLPEVCKAWEHALFEGECASRRVAVRTGFVLSEKGGAFPPLEKLAKVGLGGSVGDGMQWYAPIHMYDLCALYLWCITHSIEGPIIGAAPKPERNRDFMLSLRTVIGRTWGFSIPEGLLELGGKIAGPDPSLLTDSTRAVPLRALKEGFSFRFGTAEVAFRNIVS